MRPDDFWDATLDECILTYKGKVDEWRFMRNGFNLIYCSLIEKRESILEILPLPFDEEIESELAGDTEDLLAEYERLKAAGALG